jgi:hypothetical protein
LGKAEIEERPMTKPGLFRRLDAGIDRRGYRASIGTIKVDGRMYPFGPVGPRDCGSGALLLCRNDLRFRA